jgi:ATP-dependent Clp protease ATP-binding subunit ClpB
VGYDEGGQLTEAVRRRPYSVVLLDEIEKAHPEVFNVLLQVMDDGRLTDGHGRTVDFRNTVLIMTSNLGSELISGLDDPAEARSRIEGVLKASLRPEFLNRLDDWIVFHTLDRTAIRRIVDLQVARLEARLASRRIGIEVGAEARDFLARVGYDPDFGARPLKRAIRRHLEEPLARALLAGTFAAGTTVAAVCDDDGSIAFSQA